jgi:hypothetical protein
MSFCYTTWDGDEWQEHITTLLGLRYGPKYQPIPDRDSGDWGLEGFSDDGIAFQCYAALEPLTVSDLTDKQRDKITRDIGKLSENCAHLQGVLGPIRLHTWVLMVPRYDSKHILVHAETKAAEIRSKNLPIIANTFRISVQSDEMFLKERGMIANDLASTLPVQVSDIPEADIAIWTVQNTSFDGVLTEKLKKLSCSQPQRDALKVQLIKHFLEGQNLLQFFHDNYPEVFAQLQQCKTARERIVKTESLLNNSTATSHVKALVDAYHQRILADVKSISPNNADILAYEAIADWLIRCPLDFPQPT